MSHLSLEPVVVIERKRVLQSAATLVVDVCGGVIIYNMGLFNFKKNKGHDEYLTTCTFAGGCLKSLDFMRLGFMQELDLGGG